jgi:hypothetical protein
VHKITVTGGKWNSEGGWICYFYEENGVCEKWLKQTLFSNFPILEFVHTSAQYMKAACSSETLVILKTTLFHNLKHHILKPPLHHGDNLHKDEACENCSETYAIFSKVDSGYVIVLKLLCGRERF